MQTVTCQQGFWRRTQVTTRLKKYIVNNSVRTPNSSNCDEKDDDGWRNSSVGYCCVMKLQCKWIQSSVCDKWLHENCTILSKTWIWREIYKSLKVLTIIRKYESVPYRRTTATSLWTSLHLWHLAPHHWQNFVILTTVNKQSKAFETSRPLYSTDPTTPATHSDVTPLAIRICKNLAERKVGHRCWFNWLPTAQSVGQEWNRLGSQQNWLFYSHLTASQLALWLTFGSA